MNQVMEPEAAGWDGIAETWFDSEEAAARAFDTEPMRTRLEADRPQFIDEVRVFYVTEHVVVPSRSVDQSR